MTEQNPDVNIIQTDDEEESGSNSMVWISSISSFFSWIALLVFVILTAFSVYGTLSQGVRLGLNLSTLYTIVNWLVLFVVGVSLFLILQAAAKALLILLDIRDSTFEE